MAINSVIAIHHQQKAIGWLAWLAASAAMPGVKLSNLNREIFLQCLMAQSMAS